MTAAIRGAMTEGLDETPSETEPVREPAGRARVLVVDDDNRNLIALTEVLGDLAEVVCASSGEEALRHLLRQQFAVIILDVLMPAMDGYEAARLIRARVQTRDTPIIFLTAINKEDAHLLKGYDSGAVDYVFKPFEPLIIRSKVQVFVSLYEKTREIEEKAAMQERLLKERLEAEQERMRVLEALRASEEREAILLRSLPLALYIRDGETKEPRFVSGNIATITGFAADDFLTRKGLWHERIHPDDQPIFDRPWAGEERNCEFRWRHADGHYVYLLDQAVRLPGRGNIAGTLRDISAEHRLREQLQQSQKMDALGKLTGGIAHDFNNLLAAILSGISLIERRTPLDDRSRQIMEMTRHAVGQGKQLVDRMLAFSRRQSLSPHVVDLEETRRALDGLLNPILGGMISLEWKASDKLWPVFVDPAQLELSIMNLVLNARDAMPGGGTVTLSLANTTIDQPRGELPPGDYVVITVADNGEGIPPDLIGKVMEPFFTTKEVGKGTGLGLSTTYGFARQSGGTLEIESNSGAGTRVEIWLPRSDRQALSGFAARDSEGPASAEINGLRVLLVDDSDSLRRFTEEHLADMGFTVTTAEGGAAARAVIEGSPAAHDVIVTDYAMPGTSGLDLIRFARNARAGYPAVIITGYADTGAMAECPPDVPVVSKPFAVPRLAEAIMSVASRR